MFDPQHVWGWRIQNVHVQMCVLAARSFRKDLLQYIYSESISDGFTKGYLPKSHSWWFNDACECVSEPVSVSGTVCLPGGLLSAKFRKWLPLMISTDRRPVVALYDKPSSSSGFPPWDTDWLEEAMSLCALKDAWESIVCGEGDGEMPMWPNSLVFLCKV